VIEVLLECKNVTCEKVANLLSKFKGTFAHSFTVWLYDKSVFAYFRVKCVPELNEFTKLLKRIKKIEFRYRTIKKRGNNYGKS